MFEILPSESKHQQSNSGFECKKLQLWILGKMPTEVLGDPFEISMPAGVKKVEPEVTLNKGRNRPYELRSILSSKPQGR